MYAPKPLFFNLIVINNWYRFSMNSWIEYWGILILFNVLHNPLAHSPLNWFVQLVFLVCKKNGVTVALCKFDHDRKQKHLSQYKHDISVLKKYIWSQKVYKKIKNLFLEKKKEKIFVFTCKILFFESLEGHKSRFSNLRLYRTTLR